MPAWMSSGLRLSHASRYRVVAFFGVLLGGDVLRGLAGDAVHFEFLEIPHVDAGAFQFTEAHGPATHESAPEHAVKNLGCLFPVFSPCLSGIELRHVFSDGGGELIGNDRHGFLDEFRAGF